MPIVKNPDMAGYEPPPLMKGLLTFKVVGCKPCANGSIMFKHECTESGQFAGRQVTEFLQTDTSGMKEDWMVERNKARWHELGEALDFDPTDFDTDTVIGKDFSASCAPLKNRDGVMEDAIKRYIKAAPAF